LYRTAPRSSRSTPDGCGLSLDAERAGRAGRAARGLSGSLAWPERRFAGSR
jgi:hypothetical protein